MSSPEEYRDLPIDRSVDNAVDDAAYWDISDTVNGRIQFAMHFVADRNAIQSVYLAVDDAVNRAVYGAVSEAFQRGFSRE